MSTWTSFLLAFTALLPLINPPGSALIFLGLVGAKPAQTYRQLARKIAIATFFFLVIVEFGGSLLLDFFGISLPIIQLTGGVVAVMVTLSAHATGNRFLDKVQEHVGITLAVIALSASVYVCYAYAPKLIRAISPATVHGLLRIIAFILMCIGVQIAWNGLAQSVAKLTFH